MNVQYKLVLKKMTFICLTLSSILLSSDVEAGVCFSKGSADTEENNRNNIRHHNRRRRPQRETADGFLASAIKLREREENRAQKADDLFDKVVGALLIKIAPKVKEGERDSLVRALNDFLEE